jgi:hypothetical protein
MKSAPPLPVRLLIVGGAILVAVLFALGAAADAYLRQQPTTEMALATCALRGGKVTGTRWMADACITRFADGGKPCANASECRGGCYAETDCGTEFCASPAPGPPAIGTPARGVCLRDNYPYNEVVKIDRGRVVDSSIAD